MFIINEKVGRDACLLLVQNKGQAGAANVVPEGGLQRL